MTRLARLGRALATTDHKVIARRSLVSGLVFLAVGGALAMVLRWQRAFPGEPVPLVGGLLFGGAGGAVTPPAYTALFTAHGLFMIFFAVTPILIGGLGTFVVPLAIGARRMARPGLTALSFWLTSAAQVLAVVSLVAPSHAPSAGWTSFPPLSTGASAPGAGQTVLMVAIVLAGAATTAGSINLCATVIARRAPGMTALRLPLSVWGVTLAAALSALFAPILFAATALLLLDRVGGTAVFAAGAGDPILYQHLFWIFGHPEVYILILPVWGVLGDLVAFFSRRPAFWYGGQVLAMGSIATMAALVYGHHMFRSGLSPVVGAAFELLTLAISAPATVLMVNWLATLWRGSLRLTTPMLFSLGTIAVLGLGGLSGLFLGSITIDVYLHDTMWVVGHFHLIMAAATLLGSFAAIHFWFPKMTGRMLDERLGRVHFAGTLVFAIAAFGGMLALGYLGQPRRYFDSAGLGYLDGARALDRWVSWSAFALGGFQLVFFANLVASLRRGRPAGENPWQAPTLEWATSSPPPADNFAAPPRVWRGPHELGAAGQDGRDWVGQGEPPGPGTPGRAAAGEAEARRETPGQGVGWEPEDKGAALAGAVLSTMTVAALAVGAGALLLASVFQGGPGAAAPSPASAACLVALSAAALLSGRGIGRRRRGAVAALLVVAASARAAGVLAWLKFWPPAPATTPIVALAGCHLLLVVALAVAALRGVRRRPPARALIAAAAVLAALLAALGWEAP